MRASSAKEVTAPGKKILCTPLFIVSPSSKDCLIAIHFCILVLSYKHRACILFWYMHLLSFCRHITYIYERKFQNRYTTSSWVRFGIFTADFGASRRFWPPTMPPTCLPIVMMHLSTGLMIDHLGPTFPSSPYAVFTWRHWAKVPTFFFILNELPVKTL